MRVLVFGPKVGLGLYDPLKMDFAARRLAPQAELTGGKTALCRQKKCE
jgi:hypothetical protein